MDKSTRAVFLGNIAYEASEPELIHLCKTVGPVVQFRLMFDRESGRPKGYAFCEFTSADVARSAIRNLNGYMLNGRPLRVDYADSDMPPGGPMPANPAMQPTGIPQAHPHSQPLAPYGSAPPDMRSYGGPSTHQPPSYHAGHVPPSHPIPRQSPPSSASLPAPPPPTYYGGAPAPRPVVQEPALQQHIHHGDALTPSQLQQLLLSMKTMVQQQPDAARQLLFQKPQLAYTLLSTLWRYALIESKTVDAILVHATHAAANTDSQSPFQPPPLNSHQVPHSHSTSQPAPMPHPASHLAPSPAAAPLLHYTEAQKEAILKKAASLTPAQFDQLAPDLRNAILLLRQQDKK
jgi:cleavage stimulation factor subunit 2